MSNSEQFGGSRPFRITTYTSGSGTFTPAVANSWCRITLVGAGAGGRRGATVTAGGGGGGGHTRRVWMQVAGALTYSVGAAGAGATADNTYGTAGGSTSLGNLVAQGGRVPTGTGAGGQGGGGAGGVVDGCGGGGEGGLGLVHEGLPSLRVVVVCVLAAPAGGSGAAVVVALSWREAAVDDEERVRNRARMRRCSGGVSSVTAHRRRSPTCGCRAGGDPPTSTPCRTAHGTGRGGRVPCGVVS